MESIKRIIYWYYNDNGERLEEKSMIDLYEDNTTMKIYFGYKQSQHWHTVKDISIKLANKYKQ